MLLDGIASAMGGVSEYVHPEEDIAAKVASFYNKASYPVLTNVELKALSDKVELVNLHPHVPSDLYAGSQLVVLGRYTGEGTIALRLSGRVSDKVETFDYEVKFPATDSQHGFIEVLWAKREIGYLLDAIRLHGEKKELVEDVVRLSTEYGIQTPYTSYLIQDDGAPHTMGKAPEGGNKKAGGRPVPVPPGAPQMAMKGEAKEKLNSFSPDPAPAPAPSVVPSDEPMVARAREEEKQQKELAKDLETGFQKADGKAAVETASYLRKLKEAERADTGKLAVFRKAAGTRFFQYRNLWVDERFQETHAVTSIKFGSAAYFRLVELHPELVEVLKLGEAIVFVTAPGKALVVSGKGDEQITDAKADALFK
jgi:Ca-activated chloride channel family protein